MDLRGTDSECFDFPILLNGSTTLSMTSNLLFGNLQHGIEESSWVPVHVCAGDGLNSSPGVQLHQGVDNRVPDCVGRFRSRLVLVLQRIPRFSVPKRSEERRVGKECRSGW